MQIEDTSQFYTNYNELQLAPLKIHSMEWIVKTAIWDISILIRALIYIKYEETGWQKEDYFQSNNHVRKTKMMIILYTY